MPKHYKMKRNSAGQFVAAGRASNPRPKKHHKKAAAKKHRPNWYGAGAVAPMVANTRRKGRRRNPPSELLGVPIPNMSDTLEMAGGVLGGLAGPPIAKGLLTSLVPASLLTGLGTAGPTVIKLASYVLPPVIANMIGGRTAMKYVVAGELAAVGLSLVGSLTTTAAGSLAPTGTAGYMAARRAGLSSFGRAAGMRGYVTPTTRAQLSAFPGVRSLSRGTRFKSPRR